VRSKGASRCASAVSDQTQGARIVQLLSIRVVVDDGVSGSLPILPYSILLTAPAWDDDPVAVNAQDHLMMIMMG